jgi:hypothetical protein
MLDTFADFLDNPAVVTSGRLIPWRFAYSATRTHSPHGFQMALGAHVAFRFAPELLISLAFAHFHRYI